MGNEEIKVKEENVQTHSSEYNDAAFYLKARIMKADTKSTIIANGKCQTAYLAGQVLLESLGQGIDHEAVVIKETGLEFKEMDEMLAGYEGMGFRFPVISQG